jgi:hypothetical protein
MTSKEECDHLETTAVGVEPDGSVIYECDECHELWCSADDDIIPLSLAEVCA